MATRPYMPGVPAAGHLTDRGYWHPGSATGCRKCPGTCPHCTSANTVVHHHGERHGWHAGKTEDCPLCKTDERQKEQTA